MAVIDLLDPDTVDIWIKATLKASNAAMTAYKGRFRERSAVPGGWASEGKYVTWTRYVDESFVYPAGPNLEAHTHRVVIANIRAVQAFEGGQISWRALKPDYDLLCSLFCGVTCVPVLGEGSVQVGRIIWSRYLAEIENPFMDGDVQLAERGPRIRVVHS